MNKRVAVITFHRALNYGAILQAFALENILSEIGIHTEIIDYRCPRIECIYRPFDIRHCKDLSSGAKKCVKSFGLIKKRHKLNKVTKKHLYITKKCKTKTDVQRTVSGFKTIITGSDQVLNPEASGGDFSYFLDFADSGVEKIAYAASIGYETFPKKYEPECIEQLIHTCLYDGRVQVRNRKSTCFSSRQRL